jgi:dTDP-4-amino-4,6-dideoxygalactose transaminase
MATMRVLPPAAEPFRLNDAKRRILRPSERVRYLESGTAALAFALATLAQSAKEKGAAQRDVLLPAYACPDVVSGVLFAGLRPKLVDLAPSSCFPSADQWQAACDRDTLAVLTVGFLGLRDPFVPARGDSAALPIHLEDCCQVHPGTVQHTEDRTYVYSFGRGKPVSLLHGGAAVFAGNATVPAAPDATHKSLLELICRGLAYNTMRTPAIYGLVRKMPGLRLGATVFKPLRAIRAMHPGMAERLSIRVLNADARIQRQLAIQARLATLAAAFPIVDLWSRHGTGEDWLLRYPVLLPDRASRDRALAELDARGLGASAFYAAALPNIQGVPLPDGARGAAVRAQQFADRLITLPLHDAVREEDIDTMATVIARTLEVA